jgi:hypothetical protein
MTRYLVFLLIATSLSPAQNFPRTWVNPSSCVSGESGCTENSLHTIPRANALNATLFPGSDIGAQINAAFASCSGRCKVEVPQGSYNYSTTIQIPVHSAGGAVLECDSQSTMLNYTGTGDAMEAFGTGDAESGILVQNCGLVSASSAGTVNGLHLRALGQAVFENIRITGFSGDGVLNEGANTITFNSPDIEGNAINIHNVGVVVNGIGYSANSVKIFGGVLGYAKLWGVFEDVSQAVLAFPNGGNVYDGVVFEANGPDGQTSGNAFLQGCDGCVITNSYLEFFSTRHIPYNVVVGDSSTNGIGGLDSSPQGVKIVDNHLLSDNAVTSIDLINGRMPIVNANSEVGNVTNFIYEGASVQYSYIGHNIALDATNYLTGPGAASNAPISSIDASAPTPSGVGFNSLTGDAQDLEIRTRPGGTDNIVGVNSAGNEVYSIDNNGVANFGGVKVENTGLIFDTALARISTVGGNNMIAGTIVVSNSTSGSVTFVGTYNTPPSCQITPLGDIAVTSPPIRPKATRLAGSTTSIGRLPAPNTSVIVLSNVPRWWVTTSKTSVTANVSAPANATFSYLCVGDAN